VIRSPEPLEKAIGSTSGTMNRELPEASVSPRDHGSPQRGRNPGFGFGSLTLTVREENRSLSGRTRYFDIEVIRYRSHVIGRVDQAPRVWMCELGRGMRNGKGRVRRS
jgi:hypothetical protein